MKFDVLIINLDMWDVRHFYAWREMPGNLKIIFFTSVIGSVLYVYAELPLDQLCRRQVALVLRSSMC